MAGTPVKQLHLSVRVNNVLQRMGIHSVEELVETPLEDIARQRNIGVKTLDEIRTALQGANLMTAADPRGAKGFSDEQLAEMSRHSVDELNLPVRPYNILCKAGYLTIDNVAKLAEADFTRMKGLGEKSADEIKDAVALWVQNNIFFDIGSAAGTVDAELKSLFQDIAAELEPVTHLYWRQLYAYTVAEGVSGDIRSGDRDTAVRTVLMLPQLHERIKSFWESLSDNGVVTPAALSDRLASFGSTFDSALLIDTSLRSGILTRHRNALLVTRDTFSEVCSRLCDPNDRDTQILRLRTEGESLKDIGDLFALTRERVRQITEKLVHKFPLLFEDYFSEPYQYFYMPRAQFIRAFPEITEEGYGFLSIRYSRGHREFNSGSLAEYTGLWKDRLDEFLPEERERNDRRTVSKPEMVMRVLRENADTPLSNEEFKKEYYSYIQRKGYPAERLRINMRTVSNYLRNTRGIVFNRENKVRYCAADPLLIWESVDFTRYRNMIVSSDLIFRDYRDVMEELDIRDGYELFYVIKTSLSMWDAAQFPIHCRRVPVIVMGEASEEVQAVKLLKEISPVAYPDYYEAYEERYGLRKESAQGNSAISNAVNPYYSNGQYVIDVPSIDDRDVEPLLDALSEKPLWFIEDIEELFDKVCVHTARDAINAAAFRRIGYSLHTTYAYDSSYGTASKFFNEIIFSKDIVDLNALDRRIANLPVFNSVLDKKKKSLEYIETAPKILMSLAKVEAVYGLTIDEIRELQSMLSVYYDLPFFNGRSIWHEIENLRIVRKLQGNDWLLTCIMRQQDRVASLPVTGGIILSLDSNSLSISRICEWISSEYGTMPINALEKRFNDLFGTRITTSKLAEKLKTSGSWNRVVTNSMDEYLDKLADDDISDMSADNL